MSLKARVISWMGILGKYLSVVFNDALHKELVIVVPLARQIVAEVAFDPTLLSSSEKRNAAIVRIVAKLASQQMAVGQDVVRFAIELAYQDFKISPEAAAVPTQPKSEAPIV